MAPFAVWGIWTGTQFLPGVFQDPNFRLFMIGILIVAVILYRPEGILPERRRGAQRGGSYLVTHAQVPGLGPRVDRVALRFLYP